MRYDAFHPLLGDNLGVGPEAGGAVEIVRQVGSGVCRDVSFSGDADEVHVTECVYDLLCGEVPASAVDLFRKVLVEYQGEEAGEEVRLDAVVPLKEHGPGLEIGLCDAEAVFDYPASPVCLDDCRSVVLEVGAYAVKAVETGLLVYHLPVEGVTFSSNYLTEPFSADGHT